MNPHHMAGASRSAPQGAGFPAGPVHHPGRDHPPLGANEQRKVPVNLGYGPSDGLGHPLLWPSLPEGSEDPLS